MKGQDSARQYAELHRFLKSCLLAVDGVLESEDAVLMTPGDGEPLREDGWAWHGMSVPFRFRDLDCELGVYVYAQAPPGQEIGKTRAWFEAYGGQNEPVVELPFRPSLDPAYLEELRGTFIDAWCGSDLVRGGSR